MTLANMRKAITPAVLAIIAVVTQWIASGNLDFPELRTALAGLVTAFFVWLIPNDPPEASPLRKSS